EVFFTNGVPQSKQNFAAGGLSALQFVQGFPGSVAGGGSAACARGGGGAGGGRRPTDGGLPAPADVCARGGGGGGGTNGSGGVLSALRPMVRPASAASSSE